MDFIYSRLNNNLIDINRLDTITLLKCEKDETPIEGLKIGDYYLKFTIVDSDRVTYCDLSSLNKDDKDLLDRIINDEKTFDQRIIDLENSLNTKIDDLDKSIDDRITKDEEYFGERCLYKSTTNASKWESKEGAFTGYLGNQSETTVKAKVGFNIENNISYLPSYPTVTGTYYAFNNQDNSLTGKLNLTPINSNASPLFSFTGSGTLSMGQRNIYLDTNWFNQSPDNINLCLPSKSGILITENDAMGCLYIEVEDLETKEVVLTLDQCNYLKKYPKAMFALSQISPGDRYRYFYKVNNGFFKDDVIYYTRGYIATFITMVSGNRIGRARLQRDADRDYLIIEYYNNASKEELEKVQNILNQEISDRKTAIETEQKERQDTDKILQTNIDNEVIARDNADWELQQNIDTEQARAQREENDIRANLSQEIITRETEVQELQEECSNITQGIQEFSNSINIKFQEKELEITKNTDDITKITSNINDYVNQTDNHLNNLDSTVNSLENNLSTLVAKEAADIINIQTSIAKEIDDRQNVDTKLQDNIDNEISTRELQYNDLQYQINTEVIRAEKAEETLQTNLNTEITNREQAISKEQTVINSEVSRAKNREDEIENDFNNKLTDISEDIVNALSESNQYTDNIVNIEKTRAIGEEEALSSRIKTIEETIDSEVYSTMASLVFEEL